MYQFTCKRCRASRNVDLPCDAEEEAYYGSFLVCPACSAHDRVNELLYWVFFGIKVIGLTLLLSLAAALTTPFLWIFPPLGVAALWADHLRFRRKLALVMTGAVVTNGERRERLMLPR